jgi:signal transduction histidine kinase
MENKISLNGVNVRTKETPFGEYLCVTDLAKVVGDKTGKIIGNWFSLIGTIEFLKEWELRYNAKNFNVLRYQDIRINAGTLKFSLSAKKWIEETSATGVISEAGRYGGTYAHNAIALEFCSAISPAFKLGVYVDYIELKEEKAQQWLKTYQFYLGKIEDNSMENNRLAKDLHDNLRKLKERE